MPRNNIRSNQRSRIVPSIDFAELHKENGGQMSATATEHDRLWLSLLPNLQPGDHIAATRKNGMYEHHGIFEGTHRGYPSVIHFQGPVTSLVKGAAPRFCISKCGYQHPENGGLVISCIDCFSQGGEMLKFQYMTDVRLVSDRDANWNRLKDGKVIRGYRDNKKYFLEHFLDGELYGHSRVPKEKLSGYTLDDQVRFYERMMSTRSSEVVLDKALKSNFKPYNLCCNNCEHFVVYCKTGLRRSIQVQNLRKMIL